jgi:Gas vesicle protein
MSMERGLHTGSSSASLVDLLDRVLDKGLVVAGDISISLANVELLTIRIRLLVCSIDKAEQIGLNWWRYESRLTGNGSSDEVAKLQARVAELEQQLKAVSGTSKGGMSRGSR